MQQAADVLDYQHKPGLIVVLTDGEETCGGSPCDLGAQLHGSAMHLTVHIIGFRMKDFSWTGEQSILDAKCLAEKNGGLYISAEAEQDLIDALEKTLGCPMLSQRIDDSRSIQEIRPSRFGEVRLAGSPARDDVCERDLLLDLLPQCSASRPGCRSASCRARIRKADRAI